MGDEEKGIVRFGCRGSEYYRRDKESVGLIRKIESLNTNGKIQALGDDDSACLVRRHSDSRLHLDRPSSFFKSGRADWLRTTLVDPHFFSLGGNPLCHRIHRRPLLETPMQAQ